MTTKALVNDNGDVLNIAVFHEEEIEGNWIEYTSLNPAYIGGTYEAGFFYPPKPFESWIKNTEIYTWEPPVSYPTDGKDYRWDESTTSWVEVELPA